MITQYALKKLNRMLNQYGMDYADIYIEKYKPDRKKLRKASAKDVEKMKALAWKINDKAAPLGLVSPCICRSLWCYRLLSKKNFDVEMKIGIKSYPFEAHAWIEYNGEVINDTKEHAGGYAVFDPEMTKNLLAGQA